METYRLNSKLIEDNAEFVLQTSNDSDIGNVLSHVYVNGRLKETYEYHITDCHDDNEMLKAIKKKHNDKKREIEALLETYRNVLATGSAQSMFELGTAFYYENLYDQSIKLFDTILKLDPDHHQALDFLCRLHVLTGKPKQAIEFGYRAVNLKPHFADYHNNLGEAYLRGKLYSKAVEVFEKAIEINLYYADGYFNLALALLENAIENQDRDLMSNYSMRIENSLSKAKLIYENYLEPDFSNAVASFKERDIKKALELLIGVKADKKAKQDNEFAPFYRKYLLSTEYITEKTINERISYLKKQIESNPSYFDMNLELGRCFFELSRISWQNGMEQFNLALEGNPELKNISGILDDIHSEYSRICDQVGKIVRKGS